MEQPNILIEIMEKVGIPLLTLIGGWFLHLWRSRQKKQQDILANVQQILQMQKDYIADQDTQNKKNCDMIARLERKLDEKRESIRQANKCPHTVSEAGCPVLIHEDYLDEKCKNCNYKEEDAHSENQDR